MKKVISLIIKINNASFAWYVAGVAIIFSMHYTYPAFVRETGIPLRGLVWFIAMSTALKAYDSAFRPRDPQKTLTDIKKKIITRLRPITLSLLGSSIMTWALFSYEANKSVYRTLGASGLTPATSAFLFFILYWCVVISVIREEDSKDIVITPTAIKKIYEERQEHNRTERLSKRFPLRRHAHKTEYESIAKYIHAEESVLDAGCGDGSLAIMLAQKGAEITACDISIENIATAKEESAQRGLDSHASFIVADAENLPFADNSFDWVISSHVLEHVPNFEKALAEIRRVTKKRAIIAMPTCLNPCAAVILGDDTFWTVSRWSATAWFVGLIRIIFNLGGTGVDERYAGDERLPHIWRYPWVMRRELQHAGFTIVSFEASSLCLPYCNWLIPLIKKMECYKTSPIIRNLGYGSIAVVQK